ncbi:MAG: hypothetical protein R3C49_23695 [Planctomycetaceae bacterium]
MARAFEKVAAQNIADWQSLPDFYNLDDNLDRLEEFAEHFAAADIVFVLLELPCNREIFDSPRFQRIRDGINGRSGLRKLDVLRPDAPDLYHCNDGLHMDRDSSRRYSVYVATQVNRILQRRGLHRIPRRGNDFQ